MLLDIARPDKITGADINAICQEVSDCGLSSLSSTLTCLKIILLQEKRELLGVVASLQYLCSTAVHTYSCAHLQLCTCFNLMLKKTLLNHF